MRPPGAGPFIIPGQKFENNLVEVYMVMKHTKYQVSMPCGYRQKYFFVFPI